jgi:hypothetical protein
MSALSRVRLASCYPIFNSFLVALILVAPPIKSYFFGAFRSARPLLIRLQVSEIARGGSGSDVYKAATHVYIASSAPASSSKS